MNSNFWIHGVTDDFLNRANTPRHHIWGLLSIKKDKLDVGLSTCTDAATAAAELFDLEMTAIAGVFCTTTMLRIG